MKKIITKSEIIKAGKHAILVSVFVIAITSFAAWTEPTSTVPGANLPPLISSGASAQSKTGAFGAGISNIAQFNADTSATNGVTLESQGKSSLGPTAIFGDLYVAGDSVTLGGLKNTTNAPKALCIDQTSRVVLCP